MAIMCLQTVYGMDLEDKAAVEKYRTPLTLQVRDDVHVLVARHLVLGISQELFVREERLNQAKRQNAEAIKNEGLIASELVQSDVDPPVCV